MVLVNSGDSCKLGDSGNSRESGDFGDHCDSDGSGHSIESADSGESGASGESGYSGDTVGSGKLVYAVLVQGVPKKMQHSILQLKSVVEVRFQFSTCVLDSEF